MTYREAKKYMLCMCYTLQELKEKRGALLVGEAPAVPSRLLDTATLDEVEEAIREYDSERFATERETLSMKHLDLVAGHVAQDLGLEYYDNDDAKGLERGIRSLCVCERKADLQKRLDDIRAGRPWPGPPAGGSTRRCCISGANMSERGLLSDGRPCIAFSARLTLADPGRPGFDVVWREKKPDWGWDEHGWYYGEPTVRNHGEFAALAPVAGQDGAPGWTLYGGGVELTPCSPEDALV